MNRERISRREMLRILIGGCVGIGLSGLGFKLWQNPSAVGQKTPIPSSSGISHRNTKVTITGDGSTYLATRDDGSVITGGTDPTSVINESLNKGLTLGRAYKESVGLKGNFLNIRTILIPSYVILDLSDAYLKQANGIHNHLLTNKDKTTDGNTCIDIHGGLIDGNRAGNLRDQVDPGLAGYDLMNTIHLENVKDCSIQGILLTNGYYHGLRIRNSTNVHISNSSFKSALLESISISGYGQPLGTCKQIRVLDNAIFNSGNSAISTVKASDVLISGNTCDTILGSATGITINGLNNQVVNNSIRNTHLDSISIAQLNLPEFNASGSFVSGNLCQGSRSANGITLLGYGCRDVLIMGNQVVDAAEGISISANNQNILISNNIIHSCRNSGIRVSGVKGFDIKFIKISNNTCYNNGIGSDPNPLNKAGIRLSADVAGILHDCIIESNCCFDDRKSAKTQDYGIRLVKTKDCVVRSNYLRDNIKSGISNVDNIGIIAHDNDGQI